MPTPPASTEPHALGDDSPNDLELDLDVDARLRSTAKHREPLPQHLDFLAGLGLRSEAESPETRAEKVAGPSTGTVGPSS